MNSCLKLLLTLSLISSFLMMEEIYSSEASVITIAARRHVPEDGILHSHRRENLKSFTALTGWALQQRCNVLLVTYELGFYIPEDDILHSDRCKNLKCSTDYCSAKRK
jgi:hypothetical protein